MKSTTTENMNLKMSQKELDNLSLEIKSMANGLGFSQVGITDTNLYNHEQYLNRWLENNYHGEMYYMKKHGVKRSRPEELIEGTKTVISVSMDYLHEDYKGTELIKNKDMAFISGYALGRDYHKVMKKKLQKLVDLIKSRIPAYGRVFVDSGPAASPGGYPWYQPSTPGHSALQKRRMPRSDRRSMWLPMQRHSLRKNPRWKRLVLCPPGHFRRDNQFHQ